LSAFARLFGGTATALISPTPPHQALVLAPPAKTKQTPLLALPSFVSVALEAQGVCFTPVGGRGGVVEPLPDTLASLLASAPKVASVCLRDNEGRRVFVIAAPVRADATPPPPPLLNALARVMGTTIAAAMDRELLKVASLWHTRAMLGERYCALVEDKRSVMLALSGDAAASAPAEEPPPQIFDPSLLQRAQRRSALPAALLDDETYPPLAFTRALAALLHAGGEGVESIARVTQTAVAAALDTPLVALLVPDEANRTFVATIYSGATREQVHVSARSGIVAAVARTRTPSATADVSLARGFDPHTDAVAFEKISEGGGGRFSAGGMAFLAAPGGCRGGRAKVVFVAARSRAFGGGELEFAEAVAAVAASQIEESGGGGRKPPLPAIDEDE
jgi:hypothetical protein